jgi:hypothetical protein
MSVALAVKKCRIWTRAREYEQTFERSITVTNAHMPNCAHVTLRMHVLAVSACMRAFVISDRPGLPLLRCVVLIALSFSEEVEDRRDQKAVSCASCMCKSLV